MKFGTGNGTEQVFKLWDGDLGLGTWHSQSGIPRFLNEIWDRKGDGTDILILERGYGTWDLTFTIKKLESRDL